MPYNFPLGFQLPLPILDLRLLTVESAHLALLDQVDEVLFDLAEQFQLVNYFVLVLCGFAKGLDLSVESLDLFGGDALVAEVLFEWGDLVLDFSVGSFHIVRVSRATLPQSLVRFTRGCVAALHSSSLLSGQEVFVFLLEL